MTNDKTVTMSRELERDEARHEAVKALHDIMRAVPCNSLYSLAEAVLDAGYAAPVVERQPEGRRERFQKWVLATEHPVLGFLDGHWLERGDDREGYANEYVQGLWVAFKTFASPPAPVVVDELQAIQDRHEAWIAGVEQGKAESELGTIKESEEFEKWRNAQIDVLIRNGYPEGAEAFRSLGSVQWSGWQARAYLDKVKELNQ